MGRVKVVKLVVNSFGSFLGMEKGCIILRDKKGNTTKYPLFETEIGEVVLQSGNLVSTGVLSALGFWAIDVLITTRNGYPIAMLKNLEDDAHVKTRVCQYESTKNGQGGYLAKQFVVGKIEGQNLLLNKYGPEQDQHITQIINGVRESDLRMLTKRLLSIEGKYSQHYFQQIFQLFPEKLRPTNRIGFKAYDGINNTFNLAYTLLFWKCYRALIKAHLEPYLGYLHNIRFGRPSLVCDFVELYRHLVDDFLISYCQKIKPKDFVAKTETWNNKKNKRIYLSKALTDDLTEKLFDYFRRIVKVPRIMRGEQQELETLINEEAMLLAKYLRNEREGWNPRIAVPTLSYRGFTVRIRVLSRSVCEKFNLTYELQGAQKAVDFLTKYYRIRRMKIIPDGRRVGNRNSAIYCQNKAFFTRKGLKKRFVLHELYHHIIEAKGLEMTLMKEESRLTSSLKGF